MRRLLIELVPKTCFFSNVRSEVKRSDWDKIRWKVYERAHHTCEICGKTGRNGRIECHEVWHYDDVHRIQELVGMQALCPACHEVKHFGLAEVKGNAERALLHLQRVNEWDFATAREHLRMAFAIWSDRSLSQWQLDVSLLEREYDVRPRGRDGSRR